MRLTASRICDVGSLRACGHVEWFFSSSTLSKARCRSWSASPSAAVPDAMIIAHFPRCASLICDYILGCPSLRSAVRWTDHAFLQNVKGIANRTNQEEPALDALSL